MNTNDIREHLLSKSPWVDGEATVDTVKAGDPTRPVKTVGVTWYAAMDTIRAAVEMGCDLLVTHEPTFWDHPAAEALLRNEEPALAKQKLLDETGLVVLRCHDVWDRWPKIGIRGSWAECLELGEPVLEEDKSAWTAIYAADPQPLEQFARHVARCVAPLGQDSIAVLGDPQRMVSRPSIGVGCCGPGKDMIDAGADVLIVCYDGVSYWQGCERFVELGAAVICMEHGTTEIPGLMNLANYLGETFSELAVHYIDKHPKPWTVTSG